MDPAVVPPSGDDFAVFDDIQPVLSWADAIDDDEYEALDVVIPSWAVLDPPTVKAGGPISPPVQRRAENQSFVRREFRQKTEVWRKPAPSSYCRRSPPSGFIKRPEPPVGEASQTQRRSPPSGFIKRSERPVGEASQTQRRSPPSGFIKRSERPVGEDSQTQRRSPPSGFIKRSERPVGEASPTQRRSPPSWYCHRQEYRVRNAPPAQSRTPCSGFFNRQESPVKEASPQSVEKAPPSGSLKKRRPSLALYIPPKFRPPTSGSHPSGVFKTPDPAVTEASTSQPQGPTANGVSSQDGQNTTPAKSVAQKQEMGGPEMSSIPPTTNTPAPVSECRPPTSGSHPSGVFKTPDPAVTEASPSQPQGPTANGVSSQGGQNTTPSKSVARKQEMGGPEMSSIPPTTNTPAPVSEHTPLPSGSLEKLRAPLTQAPPLHHRLPPPGFFKRPDTPVAKASSQPQGPTANGVSSQDGQNTTPAKSVAQKQEMGGPEMSSIPPTTNTPAPVSEHTPLPSGSLEKLRAPLTQAPPLHHRLPPPGFFKRPDTPVAKASSQPQGPTANGVSSQDGQNTTPAKSVAQKQEMGGPEMSSIPPTTNTPAPVSEHTPLPSGSLEKWRAPLTQAPPLHHRLPPPGFFKRPDPPVAKASSQHPDSSISSSSTVNGVRPQEGQNTTAKTLPQTQGVRSPLRTDCSVDKFKKWDTLHLSKKPTSLTTPNRPKPLLRPATFVFQEQPTVALPQTQGVRSPLSTGCSVDEMCKMLDALHLSKKPTSFTKPNRPKPLRPATFVFQEQPTVAGFAQHHTVAGLKTWTKPHAPPTPEPADEHLPAPNPNPRPCLLGKKLCRKRPRPSSDS